MSSRGPGTRAVAILMVPDVTKVRFWAWGTPPLPTSQAALPYRVANPSRSWTRIRVGLERLRGVGLVGYRGPTLTFVVRDQSSAAVAVGSRGAGGGAVRGTALVRGLARITGA